MAKEDRGFASMDRAKQVVLGKTVTTEFACFTAGNGNCRWIAELASAMDYGTDSMVLPTLFVRNMPTARMTTGLSEWIATRTAHRAPEAPVRCAVGAPMTR